MNTFPLLKNHKIKEALIYKMLLISSSWNKHFNTLSVYPEKYWIQF